MKTLWLGLPISIHALREEGDRDAEWKKSTGKEFQSTPSARRATCPAVGAVRVHKQIISIHALREEGDWDFAIFYAIFGNISIHALREEGDSKCSKSSWKVINSNPRPPRGGRLAKLIFW